ARMGASIGIDELTALLRREMTDLENDIDVIGRDRRRIGRIRDLTDEASILAKRRRQSLAGSRRPPVKDPCENRLVRGDEFLAVVDGGHRIGPRMIAAVPAFPPPSPARPAPEELSPP